MSERDHDLTRRSRAELVAEARARGLAASGWETREELLKLLGVRVAPQRGLLARAREILSVAREALGLADLVFDSRVDSGGGDRPWARTRAEEAAEQARLARAAEGARGMEHSLVDEEEAAAHRGGEGEGEGATPGLAGLAAAFAALEAGPLTTTKSSSVVTPSSARPDPSNAAAAAPPPAAATDPGEVSAEAPAPREAAPAPPEESTRQDSFVAATARSATELYVTWRLTGDGVARARSGLEASNGELRPTLRLITWDLGAGAARRVEDVPLESDTGERVLPLPEGGAVFVAAVGLGGPDGRFAPAAHCPRGSTEGPRHESPPADLDFPAEAAPAPLTPEALAAAMAIEPATGSAPRPPPPRAREESTLPPPALTRPQPPPLPSPGGRPTLRKEDRRKPRLERGGERDDRGPRSRRDRDRHGSGNRRR